ncbi:MAG: type IV pilus modification PilV family protein [Geminicoccaceae bacterium]
MNADQIRLRPLFDRGFTLLEILVALVIFALAFSVIAKTFQISLRQTVRAETLLDATALAERQLAEAGAVRPLVRGKESGLSPEGFRWHTSIELAAPVPNGLDLALYRVAVEVGPEHGGAYVTLQSLRLGAAP